MDLIPTAEHEALREVVADIVATAAPAHLFAEILDGAGPPRLGPGLWKQLAETGLLGLSVPEALGGAGAGEIEETILFEELGAGLLPAPVFSTVAQCLPLLTAAPDAADLVPAVVSGDRRYALAAQPAGSGGLTPSPARGSVVVENGTLHGERGWVLDADGADGLLVPLVGAQGPEVHLVETGTGVEIIPVDHVDSTRPAYRVRLAGAPSRVLLGPGTASAALAATGRRVALLATAEAVGICDRLLTTTVEYTSTRTQFGKPVGTYQGVSHQLADSYVDTELGRSLVLWAALDGGEQALLAATSRVLPAAVRAAERAIQLHGGIGMTWDAPLHRYYKRALLLHSLLPRPALLRAELAPTLLDH